MLISVTVFYKQHKGFVNTFEIGRFNYKEEKEDIWLCPMTKSPQPTEYNKQFDNTKTQSKCSIAQ